MGLKHVNIAQETPKRVKEEKDRFHKAMKEAMDVLISQLGQDTPIIIQAGIELESSHKDIPSEEGEAKMTASRLEMIVYGTDHNCSSASLAVFVLSIFRKDAQAKRIIAKIFKNEMIQEFMAEFMPTKGQA